MKNYSSKRIAFMGAGLVALQFITASAFAQTTSYRIIDRWKNAYVCDTGANAAYQTTTPGTNCQWSIIDAGSGFKSFRNVATNDYLHIENQTGTVQAAGGDASWYSADWTLETIDSTYSWVRNRWQSTQYMHVENQTGFVQAGTVDKNWWSTQWRFEAVTSGTASSSSKTSVASSTPSSSSKSSSSSSKSSSLAPSSLSSSSKSSTATVSSIASSTASSSAGTAVTYQAENNFFSGGVTNAGTYLQNFSAVGARAIFTVNPNTAASYAVNLNFANSSGSAKTLNIYVNGLFIKTTTLNPTGGATTWAAQAEQLNLRAGLNTVTYQYDSGNTGSVNIDSVSVPNSSALATRGATLAYQEYEAEAGTTNGQVSGASTTYLTVESESSGRKFVNLSATGQYVQWTATKAANSLVMRYNLSDTSSGGGTSGTLSLYVNGAKVQTLNLTSHYAWVYGGYPFNDNPGNGSGHHFYDESHFSGLNIPAGATVKLQKDSGDTAAYYKIDLINLEQIESAYSMPANFVSITTYGGAVANDGVDDTVAINNTINYAKSMNLGVWFPAGTFNINSKINNLSNIHVRGAGMWYTILQGSNGQGGFFATGSKVTIADLSVVSDSFVRNDGADAAAFEGNFGTGSLVQNVWVEHMKVGFWLSSGTDGLFMVNGRIRDTWADGINIAGGVKNSQISHFNIRNTGDDAMAMWSNGQANINNSFRFDTAQLPALANTFAIYGGQDNKILDCIGSDTVTASAGVNISTRFGATAFSGTTEVKRVTLNRTGGWEPNWNTSFGGLWIYAENSGINSLVAVDTVAINNSTYDGIKFSYNQNISPFTMNNVQVNGAGGYGLLFDGVTGSGNFSNVTVTGAASGGLSNSTYTIVRSSGNSGW
ncbi:MAG: hypothetical protein EOO53_02605 [Gammaproteobacteria bacterium]|nr:MAG: hypothetical protein EOO53_02605 [Gammaproteobacteria bacterium]